MTAVNDLLIQAQHWAETLRDTGRCSTAQLSALLAVDSQPQSLFSHGPQQKPLLVAFLGGTGVGKSTLLNRLAGSAIANAGLERPTSREVTLFHHQSVLLEHLPEGLPLNSVKCRQHANPNHDTIIWLDMPDFDSIEQTNHNQVRQWLPYIDVLIYVVSPERYRDNKTWQLLLKEGHKHAWLFVMNQWDLGQPEQLADFNQQLHLAGFVEPMLFYTSCVTELALADEFNRLCATLVSLSQQHSMQQLALVQQQRQVKQLLSALEQLQIELARRDYQQLNRVYQALWQNALTVFKQGLTWPVQQLAKSWLDQPLSPSKPSLWDDWAKNYFSNTLTDLLQQANQLALPDQVLKARLHKLVDQAETLVSQQTELAVRKALLNPGNRWQRLALKLTAVGEIVLPLAAMSLVGYQVFSGYYDSVHHQQAYLGADFAIHSSLMIGLSWGLPYFLHQKIQPSMEKTALRGLQLGLQQALAMLDLEVLAAIQAEQDSELELKQQLNTLIEQCQTSISHLSTQEDNVVNRLIPV